MTIRTTATLIATMTLLTRELSRMPMTRTTVTIATISSAGRSNQLPVGWNAWLAALKSKGAVDRTFGTWTPKMPMKFWKYFDHPCATEAEATVYTSTRSHPMIQAKVSPSVG